MANDLKLYPNSNLNGVPLPLDIILVKGAIRQAFTATAANDIDIPDDVDILVIYADDLYACFIQLDGNAAIPADGVFTEGLHYIPAGAIKVIDKNGASTFGVVSADANAGVVIIEPSYAYKDGRRAKQHSNI